MNIAKILDRLRIFSIYETKDEYGFYQGNNFRKNETPIFKTYYWDGLNGIFEWIMRHTRSGFIVGDKSIKVHRVEYTEKYWEKVDRVFLASAKQARLLAAQRKDQLSPHLFIGSSPDPSSKKAKYQHAKTTVCPPGIH